MLFKVKVPTSISLTPSISLIGTYTVYGIRDEDEKGKKLQNFLFMMKVNGNGNLPGNLNH